VRFLLLNQTFYPDVMATGQYLAEVAQALVERGHQVTVVTSRRAYDDPKKLFPRKETWRGIRIIRIGSTGFGKGAPWRRAIDFASFLVFCALRLLFVRRHDAIVALTSPPLISVLGAWVAKLRRSRFFYWVMDFNPDEAIAAGWLRADSFAAHVLERMSLFSLMRATRIIALDRFMRDRIVAKTICADRVIVLPPWSHDGEVRFDPEARERFRKAHGLDGKFVVMYSGNHSPCHPLDTLLQAANRLANTPDVKFCFIGGGSEWRKIREKAESGKQKEEMVGACNSALPEIKNVRDESVVQLGSANLLCLPYQPLSELSASLSAADLHVVVMGEGFVGLVHPCKIYNVLTVASPVLYIGPRPSHVSEILNELNGYAAAAAAHGSVEEVIRLINLARQQAPNLERHTPARALSNFSKRSVLPKLIGVLEAD
jgi:colanic acid biosynthesis glycosyl transferase WcaI